MGSSERETTGERIDDVHLEREKEDDGNFRKRDRNNDVTMIKLQL